VKISHIQLMQAHNAIDTMAKRYYHNNKTKNAISYEISIAYTRQHQNSMIDNL